MPKYTRHIVAVRGDTHCGQDGGLVNPETLLPEYGIDESGERVIDSWGAVKTDAFQRKMWTWHEDARKAIGTLAGTDPLTLIEMGDLTHGGYFREDARESSMSNQYLISKETLTPWLDMPELKQVYFTRGSGVHTWFKSSETLLSYNLKKEYPKKTISIGDHWMLEIGGLNFDVAHHGVHPGKRSWLRGNEFNIYMRSILIDETSFGATVPDVILRGHKHEYTRAWAWHQVGGKYWQCHGVITPPMAYINAYAVGATQSISRLSIGMIAIEIINGKLHDVHPFVHFVDLRKREIVK